MEAQSRPTLVVHEPLPNKTIWSFQGLMILKFWLDLLQIAFFPDLRYLGNQLLNFSQEKLIYQFGRQKKLSLRKVISLCLQLDLLVCRYIKLSGLMMDGIY